jgi:hypothetical protein
LTRSRPWRPRDAARRLLPILALAAACQVAPPPVRVDGPAGSVRGEHLAEALAVEGRLRSLEGQVLRLLPDAESRLDEVWVQEAPRLYRFADASYAEADGFWSEGHRRIHLRRDASSLSRTLAHELVHASLGDSWSALPGTLEEGLCDVVSARLCPEDSLSMRTGRLSAAALATGGLELEVELYLGGSTSDALRLGALTRMRLSSPRPLEVEPQEVFEVEAGLSTTALGADEKKALYGLSYLLAHRIVERRGFTGLNALCTRARREGHEEVPARWLLEAAGLPHAGREAWRQALREEFGSEELRTLVRFHPDLLSDPAARLASTEVGEGAEAVTPVSALVRLRGAGAMLALDLSVPPEPLPGILGKTPAPRASHRP